MENGWMPTQISLSRLIRTYDNRRSFLIKQVLIPALKKTLAADWEILQDRINSESAHLLRRPEFGPSLLMQQLLISGEDHRHGRHYGFDPISIGRAVWRRFSRGSREGGSTIEQQIVRVVTNRYERTILRKIREILLAVLVAEKYPKHILPAVYLTIGYYGWRMNGLDQACRRLGLSPHCTTLRDCAQLVARLKYPEPGINCTRRASQISRRAIHLCALYRRHVSDGTYGHLDGSTIRNRTTANKPLPQS
jgi:transglycosylase